MDHPGAMDHLVTAATQASPIRAAPYENTSAPGTAENPLIPKRRRRTSPAELAILEEEFLKNPLPSLKERAEIITKVKMSQRALQVWFQNRRQKEKKDAGTYPASVGSAPDPDADTSDFDRFSSAASSSVSSPPPPSQHAYDVFQSHPHPHQHHQRHPHHQMSPPLHYSHHQQLRNQYPHHSPFQLPPTAPQTSTSLPYLPASHALYAPTPSHSMPYDSAPGSIPPNNKENVSSNSSSTAASTTGSPSTSVSQNPSSQSHYSTAPAPGPGRASFELGASQKPTPVTLIPAHASTPSTITTAADASSVFPAHAPRSHHARTLSGSSSISLGPSAAPVSLSVNAGLPGGPYPTSHQTNASVNSHVGSVAAKKHVRKRPLGSHAPTARTPTLPHIFAFPPSPQRSSSGSIISPTVSSGFAALSVAPAIAAGDMLKEKDANVQREQGGVVAGGLSGIGGLGAPFDQTPAPLKRRNSALLTNESGRALLDDDEATAAAMAASASVVFGGAGDMVTDSRGGLDVWQHMESDPPSAYSPAPLTRRRMRDLVASMDSSPQQPSTATHTAQPGRPQIKRTLSLGGAPTSSTFSTATERSRAGGQDACAELALERKRARMTVATPATTTTRAGRVAVANKVVKSGGGVTTVAAVGAPKVKPKSSKSSKSSVAAAAGSAVLPAVNVAAARKGRRQASLNSQSDDSESSFSSMADLSYTSTSTAATVEIGTPGSVKGNFFPQGQGKALVGGLKVQDADNDRECAELLLGLGGF